MSTYRVSTLVGALAIAGLLLASLPGSASAHETRDVEGEFEFVVGFMEEPTYVNHLNGIDLRISYLDGHDDNDDGHNDDQEHDHNGDDPVLNAHETLNATIIFGDQTIDVDLRPVWGQDGAYTADVVPTRTGTYSFRFHGEIDGIEIDETFQGGPDTFSEVESTADLQFPAAGNGDLATDDAQTDAMAIAGIVAGLLGLAAGGAALYKVSNTGDPNPAQRRREEKQAQQRRQQQSDDEE